MERDNSRVEKLLDQLRKACEKREKDDAGSDGTDQGRCYQRRSYQSIPGNLGYLGVADQNLSRQSIFMKSQLRLIYFYQKKGA